MNGPVVSLKEYGLYAPYGLTCPEGESHHIGLQEVRQASEQGGGTAPCRKCGADVRLMSLV